jgi:Protein of unknown function (DUF1569)
MADFHSPARRAVLLERLACLTPERTPAWGRFTASAMVLHLIESIRMAKGEVRPKPRPLPLQFIVRPLVVHHLPWPKGAPTAPELLSRAPSNWNSDLAALHDAIATFPEPAAGAPLPDHPAFGKMTKRDWAVLLDRHVDHHLTQFGV